MKLKLVSGQVRRMRNLPIQGLIDVAGNFLIPPNDRPIRTRIFTPWCTFWLFLTQVLGVSRTCREALRTGQAWLSEKHGISPNTSAYFQARARLPISFLERAGSSVLKYLQAWEKQTWCGRHVKVVDGSALTLPDTPENQERYPQSSRQKKGCGFPTMRFVALFMLSSGAWLASAKGSLQQHERTLWHRLWNFLRPGDVLLADRGFCGFADFYLLLCQHVDSVMRLHQKRSTGCRKVQKLGKDDWLVAWYKTGICPKWLDQETWNRLPKTMILRHVAIWVPITGFRTRSFTLATTLLDNRVYSASDLADLYRRRWMAELFLRHIKTTMGMDILRCKTPNLVHKEFLMHQIAYNVIRAMICQSAQKHGVDPHKISLAGTCATLRQWALVICTIRSQSIIRRTVNAFFLCIASDTLPDRPNRCEPRVRKRRPKNFQLLNKPRNDFKEIYHRNKYIKSLS